MRYRADASTPHNLAAPSVMRGQLDSLSNYAITACACGADVKNRPREPGAGVSAKSTLSLLSTVSRLDLCTHTAVRGVHHFANNSQLTEGRTEKSSNGTSMVSDFPCGGTIGVFSRTCNVVKNEVENGITVKWSVVRRKGVVKRRCAGADCSGGL